jgi:hypothetical protein
MSWDRPFDNPVPLPRGGPARTFRDAADYIRKLPKEEHDRPEWRLAVQMLIDAAENRGPMLFARRAYCGRWKPKENMPSVCKKLRRADCSSNIGTVVA